MTKNKNVLKVCDSSSEFFTRNFLRASAQINTVEDLEDSVVLKNTESELMNLKISKQMLQNIQKQHKIAEIMIKIMKEQQQLNDILLHTDLQHIQSEFVFNNDSETE